MIKAIAIDNEANALKIIESHASRIPFLNLERVFTDAFEALDYLDGSKVDLVFLDINMPDINGLEFLDAAKGKFELVFTTAYSEYAVDSYNYNAADYLLKPFDFGRFLKAIMKVKDILKHDKEDYLFVKSGYEYLRINFNELLFVKGEGNYLKFVEHNRSTLSRMTFQEIKETLPEEFLAIHRSYVVNKTKITKLEKHQLHIGETAMPISQTHYEQLISNI